VRAYNKLLISLAAAFSLINVFLAFLGQKDLSVYFIVNAIAYLIITLIFVYLNPRARAALNVVSGIIFAGFLVIVTFKVIEILK
jgi:hypothetical protein